MPDSSSPPPARVLVVEDDAGNALVMKTVLERLGGMAVQVTEDGDRVLAEVAEGRWDVVVMDVSLSSTKVKGAVVDGLELTRRLKAVPRPGEPVKILLATAHAMRGDAERFLSESGADGYVAKPIVDHRLLVREVRGLLGGPRSD